MARTAKRFNALEKEKPQELMATAAKTYRTGLYGRLSSEKGNRPSDSIDNQLAIMKNFIKLHPEFSDYKVYTDSGFTGTNFNRPAFTQLMDDVRAGRINCIIVKDLSRFGRDYLETTNYIEVILPFLDVRLISVNDHFDTDEKSNGNKELEVTLKNLVNDMYAKDISKKISSTVQQNMESGKNLCSHAPYGYVIDRDDPMRRLYPNKDTAPILREIFQMVADGKTLGKVAGILYEWRINSPGDYLKTGKVYFEDDEEGHLWISSTLSRMLKNEVYLGHLAQGKKRARLYNNEKEHRVSKTEWVIVENVHEPIIPENLFHEVGKILNGKWNRTLEIRKNNAQFPQKEDRYGGLVYCACCGRRMYFTSHINRKDEEKPYREYMYSCMQSGVHRGGKAASIMESRLERIVIEMAKAEIRRLTDKGITVEHCRKVFDEKRRECEKKLAKLHDKKSRIEHEQFCGYQRYCLGEMGREEYLSYQKHCEDEIKEIGKRIAEADEAAADAKRLEERGIRMVKSLYRLNGKKAFTEELLHLLIKKITVYPGKGSGIEIEWNFSDEMFRVDERSAG